MTGKVSGGSSLACRGAKGKINVETGRLDSFCEEKGIRDIDVMKIDVKGAEFSVLGGAEDSLKNNKRMK